MREMTSLSVSAGKGCIFFPGAKESGDLLPVSKGEINENYQSVTGTSVCHLFFRRPDRAGGGRKTADGHNDKYGEFKLLGKQLFTPDATAKQEMKFLGLPQKLLNQKTI